MFSSVELRERLKKEGKINKMGSNTKLPIVALGFSVILVADTMTLASSADYVSAIKDGTGTFLVSCPPGTTLLSCGSKTLPNASLELFRQVYPINSTTCKCRDNAGITCTAWCTSLPVDNFVIAVVTSKGTFDVKCPEGTQVLGCHISPDFNTMMCQLYRSTYPSSDGRSCTCYDYYGADCIATCASNIVRYEVASTTMSGDMSSSCSGDSNAVLGVGYSTHQMIGKDDCPYAHVQDERTCLCHYAKLTDCYCICGSLII